ncbi:MAG TPA: hypothetical protein VF944_06005 [Candidatus Bathyarchaeia archaeon]
MTNPVRRRVSPKGKRATVTPELRTRNSMEVVLPRSGDTLLVDHPWSRDDFMDDLRKATRRVNADLARDPKATKKLRESRRQAREEDLHWDIQEEGEGKGSA